MSTNIKIKFLKLTQLNLALSRCKNLEKIKLIESLQRSDIILDKNILRFYKEFLKFLYLGSLVNYCVNL